jgi:hypothetical protein
MKEWKSAFTGTQSRALEVTSLNLQLSTSTPLPTSKNNAMSRHQISFFQFLGSSTMEVFY